ncbi:MAG: acyl-CoA dehydratase activase-related protein [Oscillospiraceae bacterium]|nr:acyl-CoA dehydratase activase-related protein [Oscillospiraceae bacterium]
MTTIGIPRALGYHRYGTLWETFFDELDIPFLVSPETNQAIQSQGVRHTVDESCLPLKLYMGHAAHLLDKCDALFVPRLERLGPRDEFCVRFWGLPDTVSATFQKAQLLTYELNSGLPGTHERAFLKLGRTLGKHPITTARAYARAQARQREVDFHRFSYARAELQATAPRILLAANPYITYDPYLGGTVARLIAHLGGVPIFTDAWNRTQCRAQAREISTDLYWTLNREMMGAVHQARSQVDGILLLTAFPCGSDCLANELILRRVNDVPVIQILLDEHQSHEGLTTRIESFMDMLEGRRRIG